jgi:group I intron endonuclease
MEIYKITNKVTNKVYIGKSNDSNKRLKRHFHNAKCGKSQTKLYRSIRKHGTESFVMNIIESNIPIEDINKKEIEHIEKYDSFKSGYNMTLGGDGGDTSSSIVFQESMKRLHANKKPEFYATYGMLGKTHTKITKEKQSAARKNWHKTATPKQIEERKCMGEKNGMYGKTPSNAIPVLVEGKEYPSLPKAAKAYNLSPYKLKKQYDVQQTVVQIP